MFGLLSLWKDLLLIAVVLVAWYGFKLVRRREAQRQAQLRGGGQAARRHDTVECKRCGAYVPAGGRATCDRADCPLA